MVRLIAGALLSSALFSMAIGKTDQQVKIETNFGTMVVQLDSTAAPKTVANFESYVKSGFYDGTIFHRVIKTFMIQGGGFTSDMKEKATKAPIPNEADNNLKNLRGTIAMARTQDPNSASAQFFINTVDNDFLNFKDKSVQGWGYCVFGKVIKGLNVVDSIAKVPTTTQGMFSDVPTTPVVINKIQLVKQKTQTK